MSPRNRAASSDQDDDDIGETFTDLHGRPDGDTVDDGDGDDDGEIGDDDLRVSDEGDDDEGDAEGDAGDGDQGDGEDDGEDDGDDEGAGQGQARSDFDPKDVLILTKDAELLESRKASIKAAEERFTADQTAAEAALLKAKEDGDSKGDVEATKNYAKAVAGLEALKGDKAQIASTEAEIMSRAKVLYAKAPKDKDGNPILDGTAPERTDGGGGKPARASKLLPKFKAANSWFGNSKYAKQQKRLIEIDRGLSAEGRLDKDSPAYFEEMGRRFNTEFPGLYKTPDGKAVTTGTRRRGSGTPVPQGGGGGQGRSNDSGPKAKLTKNDLAEMRKFGMDPDSKDARRSYLREKRAVS